MSDTTSPRRQPLPEPRAAGPASVRPPAEKVWPVSRRILYRGGQGMLVAAFLVAYFGGLFLAGWTSGQAQRAEEIAAEQAEELANQMRRVDEDLADGRYALALRRLDWIAGVDPQYPGLDERAAAARAGLGATPTPPTAPTTVFTPTATPRPSPTPLDDTADPAEALAAIEKLVADEAWAEAIPALLDFQAAFPRHERRRTDELLYRAYTNHGRQLITGDEIERGLFLLAQAEALGDLSQTLLDLRSHAELYLQGRAFVGVDWGAAVLYFRDLCLVAPLYQDACGELYNALVTYAELFANAQDWCPAESLYREAGQYGSSDAQREGLAEAMEGCLAATPTPTLTPTPSESPTPAALLPELTTPTPTPDN